MLGNNLIVYVVGPIKEKKVVNLNCPANKYKKPITFISLITSITFITTIIAAIMPILINKWSIREL